MQCHNVQETYNVSQLRLGNKTLSLGPDELLLKIHDLGALRLFESTNGTKLVLI